MSELLGRHQTFELPPDMKEEQVDDPFLEALLERIERQKDERIALGEGKVARVWYTENPQTHELMCVKELLHEGVSVNSFMRELEIHDTAFRAGVNVPAPYFLIETKDGARYIFMERIIGASVQDMLERGEFLEPEQYALFEASLREEVARMHNGAHVLHRDLHIGNVMVREDGTATIIDFGDAVEDVGQFDTEQDAYRARMIRNGRSVEVLLPRKDNQIFTDIKKLKKQQHRNIS